MMSVRMVSYGLLVVFLSHCKTFDSKSTRQDGNLGNNSLGLTGPSNEGMRFRASEQAARKKDPLEQTIGKRYFVGMKNQVEGSRAIHASGGHVARAFPRLNAVAAYLPEKAIAALSKNPNIEYIEDDPDRYPLAEQVPYGIPLTQSLPADLPEQDGPVTTCIIDSGFQASHEDHRTGQVTYSQSSSGEGADQDLCGHGTHVAGTITAIGGNDKGVVGVNPSGRLKLHIVKVFSGASCSWSYASDLIAAVDACRANASGPLVINMSLGGSTKSRTEQLAFANAYNAGVLSIAAAGNDGNNRYSYPASYDSVVSVAAVDEGKNVAGFSQYNDQVEVAAPGVSVLSTVPWLSEAYIVVNGTKYEGLGIENAQKAKDVTGVLVDGGDCTQQGSWSGMVVLCARGVISFYDKVKNVQSSGGIAAVIYNNEPGALNGTLGAGYSSAIPAIGITQADGISLVGSVNGSVAGTVWNYVTVGGSGYEAWNGTSMATPHVAGIAALIWNKLPGINNKTLRTALQSSAQDIGASGRDNYTGYGLVQARAAYNSLTSAPQCVVTEPVEKSCSDGKDNDCDGSVDKIDLDCAGSGACTLGLKGAACTQNSDCCSNVCKGKVGVKTCG